MYAWNANGYGSAVSLWLADRPAMSLGNGKPGLTLNAHRADVTIDHAFADGSVKDLSMAHSFLAGLWLANNDLETAHEICQSIDTPTGSFWHAIMHRREGDFANSKYWFRKVGSHPIFPTLHRHAANLTRPSPAHPTMLFLDRQVRWEPFAFVDLVEHCVRGKSPCTALALAVQQCEWELLMDFCYRAAIHG